MVPFLCLALASLGCQVKSSGVMPIETPVSLSVAVVTQDLALGDTRIAFVVLSHGRPTSEARVHLVFSYLRDQQPLVRAEADAIPYVDHHEHANLADHVDAPFYVAQVTFNQAGSWGMEAQVTHPHGDTEIARVALEVRAQPLAPGIGSRAFRSKSKTLRDAPPEELSSASSFDPDLYALSIDQALDTGLPLLVVFATPAFCTSRTCGPQLHVAEHLQERYRGRMHFIHVEVYDNPHEMARDPRLARLSPVVQEWGLPSEPWVFLVDRQGIIVARYEGFVTLEELEPEVQRILQ